MGLEPYEGRYTLQLQDWTQRNEPNDEPSTDDA